MIAGAGCVLVPYHDTEADPVLHYRVGLVFVCGVSIVAAFVDPMFEEFVRSERAAEERVSEESVGERPVSEESVSWEEEAWAAAMEEMAMAEIGPWDREGWERPVSDPAEEERAAWELEAALEVLDDMGEESGEESVEESGVERPVERPVSSELPGEEVSLSSSLSEEAGEAAASFTSFVSGGRRLREGVSAGEFDAYGDRVDADGREARGLVRSAGASGGDGRRYWWAVVVWERAVSVEAWSEAFVSSKELQGLAILHDKDSADPHVHAVVRRPRRLKASAAFVRSAVARMWGVSEEEVSVSPIDDTRSAVAYLTHESAAGSAKHRYCREEVVEAGVALSDWLAEGSVEWVSVVSDMQDVLDDVFARRGRVSFRGFVSWCHVERPEWWRLLVTRRSARLYIKDYINS